MEFLLRLTLLISLFVYYATPTFASELIHKKSIVDKHLSSKITFEKKVKVLVAFQSWADKAVTSNSDKLNDDELTQVMQYSNLLKAIAAKKLNSKNCNLASEKLLEAATKSRVFPTQPGSHFPP